MSNVTKGVREREREREREMNAIHKRDTDIQIDREKVKKCQSQQKVLEREI